MFGWAITFLIVAIVAGIFGFAGAAGTAAWIAKALFAIGLVVFLALLAAGRRRPETCRIAYRGAWLPFLGFLPALFPDVAESIQKKQIKTKA